MALGWLGDAWDWLNKPSGAGGDYIEGVAQGGIAGAQGRGYDPMGRTQIGDVAQMDQGQSDEWRRRAIDLANQYGAVASGQQAGAGELAVNRARDAALAQQYAMQAGQRGSGAAMAGRTAARTSADIGQGAAGMAAEKALADQAAARGALGQLTGQQRGMDINVAMQNMSAENQRIFQQAGLDQARNMADAQNRLRMMGMNDQAINAYLQQLQGLMGQPTNMQQVGQFAGAAGGLLSWLGVG